MLLGLGRNHPPGNGCTRYRRPSKRKARTPDKPVERAASMCPTGMDWTPARNVSVKGPLEARPRATTAEKKGLKEKLMIRPDAVMSSLPISVAGRIIPH